MSPHLLSHNDIVTELLCVLHWSEPARLAYAKALASYQRAGSPGIPIDARDYQRTYRRNRNRKQRA